MSDSTPHLARRVLRTLALAPAVALPMVAAPALAAPPETWPEGDLVGAFDFDLVAALLLFALVLTALLAGCGEEQASAFAADPQEGKLLLRQYGCGSCHSIPGVAGARGNTGPPLEGIASRVYLGGVLPNSPENMARWIRAPQRFDPRTAMPDMQVTEAHARDMVAYLANLK